MTGIRSQQASWTRPSGKSWKRSWRNWVTSRFIGLILIRCPTCPTPWSEEMLLSLISIDRTAVSVLICSFALWGFYRKKCCHNDEARSERPIVRQRHESRAKRSANCGAVLCCFHQRDSARRNETRVSWHRDNGDFVYMSQFPERRPLPRRTAMTNNKAEYIPMNTLPLRASRAYPPMSEHRR